MLKKHLLVLAVLTSLSGFPLAQADELAPVIGQQPNLLPPAEPVQASATPAAPTDTRWYAAPFGTFIATDDNKSSNGGGGGLAIGKMIDKLLMSR
ncbi:MAG: hypothetical protein EXR80_09105 [Methylococcales bacterium]|nr:hypothetical protein [Methylococcales bacterium]